MSRSRSSTSRPSSSRFAAAAAAAVRGLSDAELDRSATVLEGMPAMTAQQIVENILINHIDDHLGSIRKSLGH